MVTVSSLELEVLTANMLKEKVALEMFKVLTGKRSTCLMVLALLIGMFYSLVVDLAQPNRAFASTTSWSPPSAVDGAMVSVSCPTASFCMAVDSNGRVLHFNGTTWTPPVSIDGINYVSSVSCQTVSFCIAVDHSGNALRARE
ncbi:MAG: hypothetical protein HKL80_07200 [Acidimicrobiales bacterium]|nr:hypothetical protein [Acidimicrobiales bacterium]